MQLQPRVAGTASVIAGPYRYIRNPMSTMGILQGLSAGLFLGSFAVIGYALAGALVWNYLLRPWEERDLRQRFGAAFEDYCRCVPCWRPRLTPYLGIAAKLMVAFACLLFSQRLDAQSDLRKDLLAAMSRPDIRKIKSLILQGAPVNLKNEEDTTPLMVLVSWGDEAGVRMLLERGADVNAVDYLGRSALMDAVDLPEDHIQIIRLLLKHGINVNKGDNAGLTPLMMFASRGALKPMALLLQAGADVNARPDRTFQTPLLWAMADNHLEAAKLLLNHGAKASLKGDSGWYIWDQALNAKKEGEFVPLLLRYGLDPNMRIGLNRNWLPLMEEAIRGHLSHVKLLLKYGARVDDPGEEGETALLYAAGGGHLEIVALLAARGTSLHVRTRWGETALARAARGGKPSSLKVVQFLVQKGLRVDASNEWGETPLMEAARIGDSDVVRYLLSQGADPEKHNRDGDTAMLRAAQGGYASTAALLMDAQHLERLDKETAQRALLDTLDLHFSLHRFGGSGSEHRLEKRNPRGVGATVQLLLEKGASVQERTKEGWTPLLFGIKEVAEEPLDAWMYYWSAFDALLRAGADINAADKEGRTGLMFAARGGKTEMTRYLLDKGCKANLQDNQGKTALMYLCQRASEPYQRDHLPSYLATAQLLLKQGADRTLKDREGKTALAIAEQNKDVSALADLLKSFPMNRQRQE